MDTKLSVVILIDALGWEIVRKFKFCSGLLDRRSPLDTVLGYSSAAIPSLLSGTMPVEHGSWSMYRLSRGDSPFGYLKALPRLPHALEWRVRRLARKITDRRGLIAGYYDLYDIPVHVLGHFDVAQHQDPYVPGGLSRETIFDALAGADVPYRLWNHRTDEGANVRDLLESVGGDESVLFFYTAELDALMHRVGIFEDAVAEKLRVYERVVENVLEAGRRCGRDVAVYVLSDHGMTNVERTVDVWGALEARRLRLGRDYIAFFDATMARFWWGDRARKAAEECVVANGAGRLLGDDELSAHGCLFGDWRYGEAVVLANPGVMIVPSFMGRGAMRAMHGYDPGDVYSKGCFLTNDPSGNVPGSIVDFKAYFLKRALVGC